MTSVNSVWSQIVTDALNQGIKTSRGAVPGAKLRQLVATIAPRYGEQYPPPGREAEKFGDFLKELGSQLVVLRREGKDLLVAPVDRPELLTAGQEGDYAFLREDIFEAFTRIPRETPPNQAWYVRETDKIQWTSAEDSLNGEQFVTIPLATSDQEVEDRKAFALRPDVESHRHDLLATLGEHPAFWAFSRIVKERGLGA